MTPREKLERKVFLRALAASVVTYALALGLILLLGSWKVQETSNKAGPVLIKLGAPDAPNSISKSESLAKAEPDAAPEDIPSQEAPEEAPPAEQVPPVQPQIDPDSPNKIPAKPTPTATPVQAPTAPASPSPEETRKPSPKPTVKATAKPSPKNTPKPSPKTSASPKASASPSNTSPAPQTSTAASALSAPPGDKPTIYKGKDEGNSWELNSDKAGVNFSFSPDLTEKMPLPSKLPARIMDKLDSKIKNSSLFYTFQNFYTGPDTFGDWTYNTRYSTLNERTEIWQLLKRLGYQISNADYLQKVSRPAKFMITVGKDGGRPTKVELEQSCGSAETDEALRQGLKETSFFNDAGKEATMRFTYSFR